VQISQRLNLGFLAIAMWAAVLGHISLLKLKEISDPLKSENTKSPESTNGTEDLAYLAQIMLYYDEVSMQSVRNYAFTKDAEWKERYRDVRPKTAGIMRAMIDKATGRDIDTLRNTDKERLSLAELEDASIELVKNGRAEEAIELLESNRYQGQRTVYTGFLKDYADKTQAKHDSVLLRSLVKRVQNSTESSRRLVSIFALTALLVALGSGLFISRSISKPLAKLRAAAAEIGKGRLDTEIEVNSDDEIGLLASSFKKMKDDLKKTTTSIDDLNREIQERRKTEESLSLAYEKLEKANRELKEMQSQQVQNAKMISIGQLAAGVAHELNTPIGFVGYNFSTLKSYVEKIENVLRMYAEIIDDIESKNKSELLNRAGIVRETWDSMQIDYIIDDLAQLFEDSQQGLTRITNIVTSLKGFSRIAELTDLNEYNINDGIETTLVVANNEIKYHADVETELAEVPLIICNAGQINQVVLNLLVNAAQAIKSQERDDRGLITIKTYSTDNKVVCEISDNGPGIEAENLQHIFDPFFTTKPIGTGTGLGLSISYDIIATKHNGKLLVDSTVGEGTTFTIELPVKHAKINHKCKVENNGNENRLICG